MINGRTLRVLAAAAALSGALFAGPIGAATRVYVGIAPPPVVVETRPVAPGPGHVWVGGFHRWDGHAYLWVPGHWAQPPRHHTAWVAGHWKHAHGGWYWVDGHWH